MAYKNNKKKISSTIRKYLTAIILYFTLMVTLILVFDIFTFLTSRKNIKNEILLIEKQFIEKSINCLAINFEEMGKYDNLEKKLAIIIEKTKTINALYNSDIYIFDTNGNILLNPNEVLDSKNSLILYEKEVSNKIKNNTIFDDKFIPLTDKTNNLEKDLFYIKKLSKDNVFLGGFLNKNKSNLSLNNFIEEFSNNTRIRVISIIILTIILSILAILSIKNLFIILKKDFKNFFKFIDGLSNDSNDHSFYNYNFDEFNEAVDYTELMIEKLKQSENRYRNLFRINTVPLWEKDFSMLKETIDYFKEHKYPTFEALNKNEPDFCKDLTLLLKNIDINFATLKLFEAFNRNEFFDLYNKITIPEENEKLNRELVKAIYHGETNIKVETSFFTTSGKNINVVLHISILKNDNPPSIIISIIDMTNSKVIEQEITDEKELLSVTLKSIGEGIIAVDNSFHITLINPIAEKIIKCNVLDAVNKKLSDILVFIDENTKLKINNYIKYVKNPGDFGKMQDDIKLLDLKNNEKYITHNFSPIINHEGISIGGVIAIRDITERKKLENENLNIKKLESIGTLAGGMAHEFNNYLQTILGNISLAEIYAKENEMVKDKLKTAKNICHNAKDLSHKLLSFSMDSAPRKKRIDLLEYLTKNYLISLIPIDIKNIEINTRFQNDLWNINIAPDQLKIITSHLISNSIKAMPDGGKITVIASNDLLSLPANTSVDVGYFVKIIIKDTGLGISENNLKKIFDPYFSTNTMGDGLGLASVYYLIQNHGGYINVRSEVNIGSEFILHFPAIHTKSSIIDEDLITNIKSKGTILLMDDDPHIRTVSAEILKFYGYKCLTAENGEDAIELYKKHIHKSIKIDLVIIDLVVNSGLNGYETQKQFMEIDSNINTIVCSGYITEPAIKNPFKYGFKGKIIKPFDAKQLIHTIKEVLESEV